MMSAARPLAVVALTGALLAVAVAVQKPEPAPAPPPEPPPLTVTTAAAQYWKGNLHTHTLWSDGDDFPEMVVDWYKRNGYQFLALTEHNLLAEGDRWVDADTNATRKRAVEKYAKRFGDKWVETRTQKDKKQVRLKPFAEYRSLFDEPGKFLLIPAEEITHAYAKRPIHMNGINLR
ncbi:MAG: PHP domain-containing protein, partial [Gemmata sp.]